MAATNSELKTENIPEFTKFDHLLKSIPTCHEFLKRPNLPLYATPDWKKNALQELRVHLPRNFTEYVQENEDSPLTFFNCRKSVFKQSMTIVDFTRNISELNDHLDMLSTSLFNLVEQHPKIGNVSRISALLIVALKLIENVPWTEFDKKIGTKIMKILDKIVKELKSLRESGERLLNAVERMVGTTSRVFRAGPYDMEGHAINYRKPSSKPNETGGGDAKVKLGLTYLDELLIASGMVKLVKLAPCLKLGLLIMVLQQVKELLSTATLQLNQGINVLGKIKPPKKWNRIVSFQLSIFELALLRKSNLLLTTCTNQLSDLALFMDNNCQALYDLRYPFKILQKDLNDTVSYAPLIRQFLMFQIHFQMESRLKQYVETDCLNEEAANYIIQNFGRK